MTDRSLTVGNDLDPARRLRKSWGDKIGQTRRLRGMSRADLAAACGVTEQSVGFWERGDASPRPHLQLAVARALDVPHGVLFAIEAA